LEAAYAEAFQEWHESEDRELWDSTLSDWGPIGFGCIWPFEQSSDPAADNLP
jgi:hypothetical protein